MPHVSNSWMRSGISSHRLAQITLYSLHGPHLRPSQRGKHQCLGCTHNSTFQTIMKEKLQTQLFLQSASLTFTKTRAKKRTDGLGTRHGHARDGLGTHRRDLSALNSVQRPNNPAENIPDDLLTMICRCGIKRRPHTTSITPRC